MIPSASCRAPVPVLGAQASAITWVYWSLWNEPFRKHLFPHFPTSQTARLNIFTSCPQNKNGRRRKEKEEGKEEEKEEEEEKRKKPSTKYNFTSWSNNSDVNYCVCACVCAHTCTHVRMHNMALWTSIFTSCLEHCLMLHHGFIPLQLGGCGENSTLVVGEE